jgi:hypothetical protein
VAEGTRTIGGPSLQSLPGRFLIDHGLILTAVIVWD